MAKKIKLIEKTAVELTEMLNKQREELRVLRFSAAGSRPKDSAAPMKTRREIARILTAQHEQKAAAQETAQSK